MTDWVVKYDGPCARCGTTLIRGTPAVWDRAVRKMYCLDCAKPTEPATEPEIDRGVGGRSAWEKYDRLVGRREAAITERWGTGFAAKVVRALTTEPQTTRAWAIGAVGEEKLARELETVPGIQILNDRRVRGTRRNIDHIVIAPAGVFVVDAKNHKGMVDIRNRGWFLRPDWRLTVGGRDHSAMADAMEWQVAAVAGVLQDADSMPPITPVLCFIDADWPLIGAPHEFRGVRLETRRSLKRLLATGRVLDEAAIDDLAAVLAAALPAK
jgi:Nuclease-related domain